MNTVIGRVSWAFVRLAIFIHAFTVTLARAHK
ncbi:Uncharacterised protein [Vibrio cholerae]|nr:Uncharacterised protein [Vibrio cholerae]